MLILTRKVGQRIMVDGNKIIITVIEIRDGNKARIGIAAPEDVTIHREEVYDAIVRDSER